LETKRLLDVNILFGMAIASALCLLHNFNTCILFKAHVATLPHWLYNWGIKRKWCSFV